MLYLESPITIKDVTLYRDFLDEKLYYYLPKDVHIAKNEEKLYFAAYVDSTIHNTESDTPDHGDMGGLLCLDVEMGPTDKELAAILAELKKTAGEGVKLTPVPFEDGKVNLLMSGEDSGSKRENEPMEIWFAGTGKPSLTGKHEASFNLSMGGKEAQIVWDLLHNTPQTQMTVAYQMDFLGVIPSYNLEITVDFKATENYYNNHIDLGASVDTGNVKVLADADIDSVIQNLLNEGTIIISETDYSSDHRFTGDAASKIAIVKQLLSSELFSPTALPVSGNTVLKDAIKNAGDVKGDTTKKDGSNASSDKTKTESAQKTGIVNDDLDKAMLDKLVQSNGKEEAKVDLSTLPEEARKKLTPSGKPIITEKTEETATTESTPASGESDSGKVSVNINVGYTLRHRSISEQVKRTFKFNRREVKTCHFNSSGSLSTTENVFNPEKQVHLVHLGEGEFHETKLTFLSGVRFADFGISNVVVNWRFEDKKETDSGVLNESKTSFFKKAFHNDAEAPNVIYTAKFALPSSNELSTPEISTTDRTILVGLNSLEGKRFLNVVSGKLESSPQVFVEVLPDGKEDNSIESSQLSKEHPDFPVFIDLCDSYDIRVAYPRPSSNVPQKVVYRKLNGSLFVVNDPRRIVVSPILGEVTFTGDIIAIIVNIVASDNQKADLVLRASTPQETVCFDYEVGEDVTYGNLTVSYQVVRNGGQMDPPVKEEFPGDTENVRLKIFTI